MDFKYTFKGFLSTDLNEDLDVPGKFYVEINDEIKKIIDNACDKLKPKNSKDMFYYPYSHKFFNNRSYLVCKLNVTKKTIILNDKGDLTNKESLLNKDIHIHTIFKRYNFQSDGKKVSGVKMVVERFKLQGLLVHE